MAFYAKMHRFSHNTSRDFGDFPLAHERKTDPFDPWNIFRNA
jgi:hypothetical protein